MTARHVAVIDIGKTNVKLALVDLADLAERAVVTRPNTVLPGPPWPHFDVEGHWAFLLAHLGQFHAAHGIDAISVTTHGASVALLDQGGDLAAPVLDYEHAGPDARAADYDRVRPAFAETGSPRLPMGLNVGAQLHYMLAEDPGLAARVATLVTYPQYWTYRLTGVAASEVTSLGCHTDLWNPHLNQPSGLLDRLELGGTLAPQRRAQEVLGPIRPEIAAATGLPPTTPVHCGIHDSNASLLPHLLGREPPFSVVSTGTWVISMAIGGAAHALDPARDTLVNVNAFGQAVPSARFMGGRAFETVIAGQYAEPTEADRAEVLGGAILLLPAVIAGSGPYPGRAASWVPAEPRLGSGVRTVAASYYLGLVTATCLDLIGHRGPVVVEGPFARNRDYCAMLSAAARSPVALSESATGTSQGAALLAASGGGTTTAPVRHEDPALSRYAEAWAARVAREAGPPE